MTQTNTDYLLQVTTAATDRAYSSPGTNGGDGNFDDHLSQAATLSDDDSRSLGSSSQRTASARYDRDDRSWNGGDFKPNGPDRGNIASTQPSPPNQEEPADEAGGSKSPIENADCDEHETEKADDTTAAAVAGTSQAAKESSSKPGSKPEPKSNAAHPATTTAAAPGKKEAAEAGDHKATDKPDTQATNSAALTDAVTHADDSAQLAARAATDAGESNDDVVEPQPVGSEAKQPATAKKNAVAAKLDKGASANNDGAVSNDSAADGVRATDVSSDAAQEATAHVEASATQAKAAAKNDKSETDESSDDDSPGSSRNESRTGARNDASAQINKVDTAQLAVTAAGPTDSGANAASKSKDNEQSTKPIAVKSEPAAAAFARMARNNMTGSTDSTSNANDLPPIDPSRFIGRVAKAFQTAQDRGGTLQLRLSPPELGALRIELNVKDGVMSASLQAENSNARRLLLDHLPALRDRLAEQNIRVDRFDVDVRREGTGSQTDARGSQQQQFQHQPDEPAPRRQAQPQPRAREIAAPETVSIAPSSGGTGLNLIV